MVAGGKGAGCAFAMHPSGAIVDDLLAGDVVRDEIDQISFNAWNDLLEGFEHQRVDQKMIDGGEIRAQ